MAGSDRHAKKVRIAPATRPSSSAGSAASGCSKTPPCSCSGAAWGAEQGGRVEPFAGAAASPLPCQPGNLSAPAGQLTVPLHIHPQWLHPHNHLATLPHAQPAYMTTVSQPAPHLQLLQSCHHVGQPALGQGARHLCTHHRSNVRLQRIAAGRQAIEGKRRHGRPGNQRCCSALAASQLCLQACHHARHLPHHPIRPARPVPPPWGAHTLTAAAAPARARTRGRPGAPPA